MDLLLVAQLVLVDSLFDELLSGLVALDNVDDGGGEGVAVDGLEVLVAVTDRVILGVILQLDRGTFDEVGLNLLDVVDGEARCVKKFESAEVVDIGLLEQRDRLLR